MCVLDLGCKVSRAVRDNVHAKGARKIVSVHWDHLKALASKTHRAKY